MPDPRRRPLAAALSRSTLERGFRARLGRSPHEEIRRARLEEERRLLAEPELELSALALKSGFRTAARLCEAFQERSGTTPGAYRYGIH